MLTQELELNYKVSNSPSPILREYHSHGFGCIHSQNAFDRTVHLYQPMETFRLHMLGVKCLV